MKVGEYVRYKRPFERKETIMIGKIIRIYEPDEKHKIKGYDLDTCDVISDEFSIKSSPNIIDLIEENDYINGLRVEKNKYGDLYTSYTYMGGLVGTQEETYTTFLKDYENDYIQSIVTKEQFSQIEYRIGE